MFSGVIFFFCRKLQTKFLWRSDERCVYCCSSLSDLQTPGLPGEGWEKNWVSPIHTGLEVRSYTGVECRGRMKMSIEGAGAVLLAWKGHAGADQLGKHGRENLLRQ